MNERLEQLRKLMKERHMDAYLVPTSDFHESEYVGEYFKCRKFLTGFTGSAGTAVVTADDAGMWTDGRYFVQAAKQLEGSGFTLQKMGQEGVPSISEYLRQVMPEGGKLGFDGRVINSQMGAGLQEALEDKHVTISYEEDLLVRSGKIVRPFPQSQSGSWKKNMQANPQPRRSKTFVGK